MKYRFVFPLDHLPSWDGDHRDSAQMCWNLWHVCESLLSLKNPFITKNVFYPVGANLTTHTLVSGFFPLTFLVKLFAGGDILYPVYTYKLAVLLSYLLIGVFMFLMLRMAGFGYASSLIPSLSYAFGSFYSEHAVHLNLLAGFIIPLNIFLLLKVYKTPSLKNCTLCALSLGAGVYFSEFALFVLTGLFLYVLLLQVFRESRDQFFEKISQAGWTSIGCASGAFLIVVIPFLYYWTLSDALLPDKSWIGELSANLFGFFMPDSWSTPLYGDFFRKVTQVMNKGIGGFEAFLGYPFILFTCIGFFRLEGSYVKCAVILGVIFLILALGPALQIYKYQTGVPMPYSILKDLPLFDQNRSPVRLVAMAIPLLSFSMASGIEWVSRRLGDNGHAFAGGIFPAVLLIWTLAESYRFPDTGYQKVFVPERLSEQLEKGPVLQIPVISSPNNQMLLQTMHGEPVMTVFLARNSKEQRNLVSRFQSALDSNPGRFVSLFRQYGYKNLLISERLPVFEIQKIKRLPVHVIDLYTQPEEIIFETGERFQEGSSGSRSGTRIIRPGESEWFSFGKNLQAKRLELLVYEDDIYEVSFYRNQQSIGGMSVPPFSTLSGLRWHMIDIPVHIRKAGFDKIELKANGEKACLFACLIVSA